MRKITFFIAIISLSFLFSTSLIAQEFKVGVKGGLNLSFLSLDDVGDKNILPGFHVGVFGKIPLSSSLAFQPEVLFSTKGTKIVYDEKFLGFQIADGESKFNLNYIEVPLYLVFNLSEVFNFHVGPYAGFLMNANVETTGDILSFINVDSSEDLDRSNFNKIDYGLSGGLGLSFNSIELGFNYNLGLLKVAKDDEALSNLLGDSKNNVIQVYLGFSF